MFKYLFKQKTRKCISQILINKVGLKICKEPDSMHKYFFKRELGNEAA